MKKFGCLGSLVPGYILIVLCVMMTTLIVLTFFIPFSKNKEVKIKETERGGEEKGYCIKTISPRLIIVKSSGPKWNARNVSEAIKEIEVKNTIEQIAPITSDGYTTQFFFVVKPKP